MPTVITPLGTPPQRGQDQQTFSTNGDVLLGQLPTMVTQINTVSSELHAVQTNVATNATTATNKASEAATSAQSAATSASNAATSATTASTKASEAATSAQNAATSAANAAASSQGLVATSNSSVSIGFGTKTFNVGTGKNFSVNSPVMAVSAVDATQYMYGTVNSYTGNSLVINVLDISGSGTYSSWNVGVSGIRGPTGTSGNISAAINLKMGNPVTVSVKPDIWSVGGNTLILQGTGEITGFTNAPQAGSHRALIINETGVKITSDTNLLVYGGDQTLASGDILDVVAETVNKFRVTIRKRDGTPVVHDRGELRNFRPYYSSGVFIAPKTGWYKISLSGGSGSGGAAAGIQGGIAAATGSGAGGFASGMRYLTAGASYIVTVGAGGAAVNARSNGDTFPRAANGNAGSASSFTGTGIIPLYAFGGGSGLATVLSETINGGIGGGASGGDMNIKGGDGGSAIAVANSTAASGGGAVGVQGGTFSGGSAIASIAGTSIASGGAGVGGKGGDASHTNVSNSWGAGGGAGGGAIASVNQSQTPRTHAGPNYAGDTTQIQQSIMDATPNPLNYALGCGQWIGVGVSTAQPGGGGAGYSGSSSGFSYAGIFAGSGGASVNSTNGVQSASGGLYGGGTGGAAATQGSSGAITVTSGAGTSGGVWIEW